MALPLSRDATGLVEVKRQNDSAAMRQSPRKICFVTGTRAEFGLMRTTLQAIKSNSDLRLQIIATGMHLDPHHGNGIASIRREGWRIDQIVPWPTDSGKDLTSRAANTGLAIAGLAKCFAKLKCDIVLSVGDRVEAFAAASAAHLSGCILAHIHGGDRAAGQVDDCLRHAISKLAHVHFPATRQSANRLKKLGEDSWRIRLCGSPGVDGIANDAASWSELSQSFPGLSRRHFALLVQHPIDVNTSLEAMRMRDTFAALKKSQIEQVVAVHPNSDPGNGGIRLVLDELAGDARFFIRKDIPRALFLGLMRDAALLVGNSSSGIIEAASFHTPVVDVGPRQLGREHGPNVIHCDYGRRAIASAIRKLWDGDAFIRSRSSNVYGGNGAGRRIAAELSRLKIDPRLRRKLIVY